MNLAQIQAAETSALRAVRAAISLGAADQSPGMRALLDACTVLGEVRHFAVCLCDLDTMERDERISVDQARDLRQEARNRLILALTPSDAQ